MTSFHFPAPSSQHIWCNYRSPAFCLGKWTSTKLVLDCLQVISTNPNWVTGLARVGAISSKLTERTGLHSFHIWEQWIPRNQRLFAGNIKEKNAIKIKVGFLLKDKTIATLDLTYQVRLASRQVWYLLSAEMLLHVIKYWADAQVSDWAQSIKPCNACGREQCGERSFISFLVQLSWF